MVSVHIFCTCYVHIKNSATELLWIFSHLKFFHSLSFSLLLPLQPISPLSVKSLDKDLPSARRRVSRIASTCTNMRRRLDLGQLRHVNTATFIQAFPLKTTPTTLLWLCALKTNQNYIRLCNVISLPLYRLPKWGGNDIWAKILLESHLLSFSDGFSLHRWQCTLMGLDIAHERAITLCLDHIDCDSPSCPNSLAGTSNYVRVCAETAHFLAGRDKHRCGAFGKKKRSRQSVFIHSNGQMTPMQSHWWCWLQRKI